MSKIEVCQKSFLVDGHYEIAGYVTLFDQVYSGHDNRYCYWDKNATQSEKERALASYLNIIPGTTVNNLVNEINQAIILGNVTHILTHRVTNNSNYSKNIHLHNWSDDKLLLLTNFDMLVDSFYFKTPITEIKNQSDTIIKELLAKDPKLGNDFISSFINEYNSLVTEIKNRG